MLTPNTGTEFRTRVAKGNIAAGAYVKVSNSGDWETRCKVKDEYGNEQEYLLTELQGWGYIGEANMAFDLVEEFKGPHQKDLYGNTDIMRGRIHITKNVRGGLEGFTRARYCTPSDHVISYRYTYRELTDQEVVDMLLDEILYGASPNLESMSCVGTSTKGIDKDPNYRDGVYYLPNDKEYTMTWCYGKVIIREGADGGWYHNKDTAGRTLYEGTMDWERHKQALIRSSAVAMLRRGRKLIDEFPEIADIIAAKIKDQDRFKLNSEFPEDETSSN